MAIKLSSLTFSNKILRWVNLTASISTLSCANTLQLTDFEVKIQSLRNKLCPDNLIRVLDTTGDVNSAVKIFKWVSLQKGFQHTADTYCKIILKLGLAGKVEQMEGFCRNMVKDKCPNAKEALISLVELFVKNCRVNEAIRVLVSMNLGGFKPSVDVFNVVLGAIVKEKRGFEDVVFIYKEMVKAGVVPNVDTLNFLLEVLFETGRIESALDQFRRMNKKGCSPNSRSYEIVIKGLILSNRVDDSVIVLGEMFDVGFEPELSFYTCIIPLFCWENKLEEGIRLFRMMRASNLLPEELTYRELIRCMCKNHRLDDANNLLEEMTEIGITPAVDVLVDIVVGLCAIEKFDESVNFLEDKCGYITSPYNAMLEGCCNAGKFSMAKSILDKMAERNITDCDSWNILIRWLCENVEIRKANELLGRMITFSMLPGCATYSALVVGNSRLRKYEDALQVFRRGCIKSWVLDSVSYLELVEGLCQAGKIIEAAEVFHYMSKNGCSLNSSSFNKLISSMCGMGLVDKAIRLRGLAYSSHTSYTTLTYTKIMLGLSKLKRAKGLMVVLSQMQVDGCALDVEAYCILIQSMSAQHRTKDAVLFFNLMVNEGFVPDRETMHTLLCCLANYSQLGMVLTGIDKLVSYSDILDSSMYNVLINGLWKEGLKVEASRLLDLMLEKGWVPDATTHGLLVGSFVTKDTNGETFAYEDSMQDSVSNILAEGLGNT
ncbi:pentatricopeptide repeat-containing protein At3g53700, chloroplastic-like [Pistacia vera]|uniref:pentatricopeptide repeat-containing protein At3g53700, chloroplastic-like n=1 Tax=Pistacia vera TaxID=55513 RepID=UPI0012639442|nr:pentatricopeptide repeat-containing protein At3g53700, chloroplastic-like [Pistacia vera]